MKEQILALMKEQLKEVATRLTFDNYREMESEVHRIFTILESSETMLDTPTIHPSSVPVVEESIEYPPLISKILKEEPEPEITMDELIELEKEEEPESDIYTFERRIKGGVLPEIDAFVPEKFVHELNLHSGDKLRATFLYNIENGPARYEYELVERTPNPSKPDNIVEVHMGIVTYIPKKGGLGIEKTVNEEELIHEGERIVLGIPHDDIDALDIREGDIIDAAFYANNPNYMKVRWKYTTEEVEEEKTSPKRNPSFYKKKDDGDANNVEQIFKDKKIAVLGYEPGWTGYREEVEKRGGELITLTGRESFDSLFGSIDKSDGVVMILGHVGHTGTIFTVDYCKKNNIPNTSIKTFGRSSFVKAASSLFEK